MYGRLPLGVDDAVVGRGPFDTLFGWRDRVYKEADTSGGGGGNVNPNPRPSGSPGNPLSRAGGGGGG